MKYRSEIDGLRAIAVVPVILFHAGFELFSGGFVGVDVFFVISGYLITTIIINEMDEGKFSLLNFYERRARRILPALFFVVLCSIPFAWYLLMPSDMKDFSQSLVAVSTFSSNILFWRESGYFDTAAELKPLLHTWSLAVEEQFYILFPLFLMAAWHFGKRAIVWTLIASFIISLAMANWGAYNKPAATFFLLPTRAWELLIGSFAAFYLQRKEVSAPLWLSNLLSAVGLTCIIYSVFAFDEATPFPSLYALIPTVGTVLIILFAVKRTWTHKLLSLRGVVGVGLISYSLYLWHQPVFAFWRHYNVFDPTHTQMLFLSLLCFPLAVFTYRFVEAPFRLNATWFNRKKVFAVSSIGSFVLITFGILGHLNVGYPYRLSQTEKNIIAYSAPVSYECQNDSFCVFGSETGAQSGIAFVGDSHMGRYAYLIDRTLNELNLRAYLLTKGWCAPLLAWRSELEERCGGSSGSQFGEQLQSLLENEEIHTIVMAAEWANYTTGERHLSGASISYDFSLDGTSNYLPQNNLSEFSSALRFTLSKIGYLDKKFIIVGPVPEYNFSVPLAAFRAERNGLELQSFSMLRSTYDERNAGVFDAFQSLSEEFAVLDVWDIMCDENHCSPIDSNGYPKYNDGNHLVETGMAKIVDNIMSSAIQ